MEVATTEVVNGADGCSAAETASLSAVAVANSLSSGQLALRR